MPEKKIDGPTEADFVREIVKHIPGSADTKRGTYLIAGASILGQVARDVSRRK